MGCGDLEHRVRKALHHEELSCQVLEVCDRQMAPEALRQALLGAVIARHKALSAFA